MQLFSGVGSIGADAASGGVAFWAHVGGFIAGAGLGALVRLRGQSAQRRELPQDWQW
jgi:membrane associated rhomboid family serine protease